MMDFTFEQTPWELTMASLGKGSSLSAARFLTLMEEESEDAVEEALLELEMRGIALDVSDLPKPAGTGEAAVRLRREEELVKSDTLLEKLEENDPLRLYLEEVAGLPAAGDPQLMALRYAGGYEPVLPGLTNVMLGTVIAMAKEYVGQGVLLLDLIQEGSLGLWQGILSFRDGDFVTHAKWWIRQYIARAIMLQARQMGLGQKMKQAMQDYQETDERLLTQLGRNPTLEEIAESLHMTPEEADAVAGMLENARAMQKVKAAAAPEPVPEDEVHVEDTALFQSRQRIAELLSELDGDQVKLLQLRYGLEGGAPLSPAETGRRLGLTPEEVVIREGQILAKLRQEH